MAYTLEMVQKYPDRFIGCFVYNPRYGVQNGVEAIERYVKEHGFKMVQLQANMHAYRPDRALGLGAPGASRNAPSWACWSSCTPATGPTASRPSGCR